MKLKKDVVIKKTSAQLLLCREQKQVIVKENEQYLFHLLRKGVQDEEKLSKSIMIHEQTNEMVAGFILAQFLLKYQDYMENDNDYYEIKP